MAEIAAGFLGPALQVATWVTAPFKRQFNYLCCFTTNIASLKMEAEELHATATDLQVKVDRARDDLRVISHDVKNWFLRYNDITEKTDQILAEDPNVGSECLKLKSRFSLSKRAKKTTDLMIELHDECSKFNDDNIAQPPLSAAQRPIPLGNTCEFESRRQIEEDIMETLRLGHVNKMGICGMGGLGKTTMAKKVINRALGHVFKEVVFVTVSQTVDQSKIQKNIAEELGLPAETAARNLHARLSGPERILLVLDDVWERLELEPLGIPTNHTGCTMLLTSRNRDALSDIDDKFIFKMRVLSEEEAWNLFRDRVGECVDDGNLNSIARKVVEECGGLPIVLATVGAALTDKMNVSIWKDVLLKLERPAPDDLELEKVYNPIVVSYEFLEPIYKSVFLLCCLYGEDAHIPLEQLTYFCMGLGIFGEGIRNVEEARDRISRLTDRLKERSMLLDSKRGDKYVRMHDVVRDVCIFIAKKDKYIGGNDCRWMSSFERSEFPTGVGFPNLRLLWWPRYLYKMGGRLPKGISDLHVLSIEKNNLLTHLPLTTQSLKNLKTLVLDSCERLEALSGVGELVNLEILSCRSCDLIEELPAEMNGLNQLKVLDLTWCTNLRRIGRGIISSLVGLEELKMRWSFKKWEAEDREERENAALRELEALTNLRCLEIEIEDPTLVAENMRLSSKLEIYDIRFSDIYNIRFSDIHEIDMYELYGSNKKMILPLGKERYMGDWIEMQLFRDIECLRLIGNGANKVDLTKLEKVRYLEIENCNANNSRCNSGSSNAKIQNLLQQPQEALSGVGKLVNLEILICRDCDSIKELPAEIKGLNQLKVLDLTWCSNLRRIGRGIISSLVGLEELKMRNSFNKWEVEDREERKNAALRELETLTNLRCLEIDIEDAALAAENICLSSKLEKYDIKFSAVRDTYHQFDKKMHLLLGEERCIQDLIEMQLLKYTECLVLEGSGANEVDFTKLTNIKCLELSDCGTMKKIVTKDRISSIFFQNIKELHLSNMPALKQVWEGSSRGMDYLLPQLQFICIKSCEMMERVFLWEGEDENEENSNQSPNSHPILPKLNGLWLEDLPNLTSFYQGIQGMEFPQLRTLEIKRCSKMKIMVSKEINSDGSSNSNKQIQDLHGQPQEMSFRSLKELTTDWSPFCGSKIDLSLFHGLEELTIGSYEGSMSIITPSIAENLFNLKVLYIRSCDEMVKVIEDEEEKLVSGGEKTLLFPKLHTLTLSILWKLGSFCEWKCDVELPSLRGLYISYCHNMEYFTLGHLLTPNLKTVRIDYKDVDLRDVKDLNGIVQQHYISRPKRSGGGRR